MAVLKCYANFRMNWRRPCRWWNLGMSVEFLCVVTFSDRKSLHFCICFFLVERIYCLSLFVLEFLYGVSFCGDVPTLLYLFFVVIVLPRGPRFTVVKIPLKIPLKSIEIHWNSWNFNNKSLLFRSNPWSFMVDLRKAWWAPWQPWEPWELRWKEPWHALDMAAMVLLWEMQS